MPFDFGTGFSFGNEQTGDEDLVDKYGARLERLRANNASAGFVIVSPDLPLMRHYQAPKDALEDEQMKANLKVRLSESICTALVPCALRE